MPEFKINITGDARGAVAAAEQTKKSLEGTAQAAAKSGKSFQDALRGLQTQVPALSQIREIVLNPIAIAVAGIAGAFKIWKWRVDEMTRALGGIELPDITKRTASDVSANAKAFGEMAEALERTAAAYDSAGGAADRFEKNLKAQGDQEARLLASQKQLALAQLEAKRGSMSETEYESARVGIEQEFAGRALSQQEQQAYAQRLARVNREVALGTSAAGKLREAQGIRIATDDQDKETGRALKEQADAAAKQIEEFRGWQQRITEMQSSLPAAALGAVPFYRRYGHMTGTEAYQLESGNIANRQVTIDRYRDWQRQQQHRDALRSRRSQLYGEATSQANAALGLSLGGQAEDAATAREVRVNQQIFGNESAARAYGSLGKLAEIAGSGRAKETQLASQIHQAIQSGQGVTQEMLSSLQALIAEQEQVRAKMRQLSESVSRGSRQLRGAL